MAEAEFHLDISKTVTINAEGIGIVTNIGPERFGDRWEITKTRVFATGRCTFASYRGNEIIPDKQIEFTYGGMGDSSDTVISLAAQDKISFAFSGPAGTIATAVFSGRGYTNRRA